MAGLHRLYCVLVMESFEPLRNLLDNSSTFYLISVGMDSTYQYVNSLYSKVFEPQHGNLLGKNYAITMHPEDTVVCQAVGAQCFRYPNLVFPAKVRKHDGRGGYIATQWDYRALMDKSGNPSGIFCIGYDITTLVQTTSALEHIEHIQSHVIRKPIANLQGLVELFERAVSREEQLGLMGMIRSSVDELDLVVRSKHSGR